MTIPTKEPVDYSHRALQKRARTERNQAEKDWVAGKLTNEQHDAVLRKTNRMMRGRVDHS